MLTTSRFRSAAGIVMLACLAAVPVQAKDSEIVALSDAWATNFNSGNAAGVAALYMEDGVMMPPNAVTANGRAGIQATIEEVRSQMTGALVIMTDVTGSNGALGYAKGTWSMTDEDGNEVDKGKWLEVLQKVKGKWQIQYDMWNSDLPIPGSE